MTALILLSDWQKSQVEFWKQVDKWPAYDVSSFGRVRSYWEQYPDEKGYKHKRIGTTPRLLKEHYDKRGYPRVILRDNDRNWTVCIHRLVAMSFIPNPDDFPQVNHISAYRKDNRLDNIEWASRSRNMKHAFDNGLYDHVIKRGEDNHLSTLTEDLVREIRSLSLLWGKKGKNIAEHLGISRYAVYPVLNGTTWKHVQ